MRDPTVDDVRLGDTGFQRGNAGFNFGEHSAGDGAFGDHRLDLIDIEMADARFGVVDIATDSVRVGDDDKLVAFDRGGDSPGGGVGIDVELAACGVAGDRRDHGNRVGLHKQMQQPRVYARHISDIAQINAATLAAVQIRLFGEQHNARERMQPHRFAALAFDERHDEFVYLIAQDMLGDRERALVGVAPPHHHLRDQPGLFHRFANGFPTTVHEDGLHPHIIHEDDVGENRREGLLIIHDRSADFHDDDAIMKSLDVSERLDERLGFVDRLIHCRSTVSNRMYRIEAAKCMGALRHCQNRHVRNLRPPLKERTIAHEGLPMPTRAPTAASGYMFTGWPAASPMFEPISRATKLWIPCGPISDSPIASSGEIAAGTPLISPMEDEPAALAAVAGRCLGLRSGVLTNGRASSAIEFEPSTDFDPVWSGFDDESALAGIRRAEPAQFIEWIERFRAAGIQSQRRECPDLLAQLHHAMRRPVEMILCCALDADPSACLNAALASWYGIELIAGVALLARITKAADAVVVVDSRAPHSWFNSLRHGAADAVRIEALAADYPQSDPSLMLRALCGRRLRPGHLPTEQGAIQLDAAAAIAIGRCALLGQPMLSVPLVVRDHVLRQSFFLFAPIGMRVIDVVEQTHISPACTVFRGGDALRDITLPSGALIGSGDLVLHASAPQPWRVPDPCVRCGWCVEACPTRVQPAGVLEAAQHADSQMALSYGLDACIECGICTFVCPSHLPLLEAARHMRGATVPTVS